MELHNITLEQWLENPPLDAFRNNKKVNYYEKYNVIKQYLVENVYKDVASAANYKEPGMFYNDHGVDHVDTVIDRASELVKFENFELNAKEVYFLLCAILIHDIGNIFGRKNYEQNHYKTISHIINIFSSDTAEQTVILDIAKAHGGRTQRGSNDTISELSIEKHYGMEKVRTRLLSSILRFSDEIADDRSRASHIMLNKGELSQSPSEVFHVFSACLDSVIVNHKDNAIFLQFNIPVIFLQSKFKKLGTEVYIIDEIYNRILKMHLENIYCQKYISRFIHISKIEVNIDFINPYDKPFDSAQNTPQQIKFSLENKGYPEVPKNGIYDICPDLTNNNEKMDGEYFLKKIQITKNE